MLHPRQCFLLAAERLECFPFEVQKILLGRAGLARHVATADHECQLAGEVRLVVRDLPGLVHKVDAQLQFRG